MRDLILANSLEFVAIQEIKLIKVFDSLVHSLWGNSFCEWSFILDGGYIGELLSIQCSSKGKILFSFSGPSFLGVSLEWGLLRTFVLWLMFISNPRFL